MDDLAWPDIVHDLTTDGRRPSAIWEAIWENLLALSFQQSSQISQVVTKLLGCKVGHFILAFPKKICTRVKSSQRPGGGQVTRTTRPQVFQRAHVSSGPEQG